MATIENTANGALITLGSGRTIKMKRPVGQTFMDGMKIAGADFTLTPLCQAMLCVTHIDDEVIVPAKTPSLANKLAEKLGFDGVQIVFAWMNSYMEIIEEAETKEEIKNE